MPPSRLGLSVISVFALSSRSVFADPHTYAIDPTASRIIVHVGKAGLFGFAGHEHEVEASVKRGALVVDLAHLEASSVDLKLDARTLRVTDPGEAQKDVAKVQETMLGPQCLDSERFPEIRFVSNVISAKKPAGGGLDVTARGTLTLHGVAREVAVPVHLDVENDLVSAKGTVALKQTDFGIKPISVAGVVKVKDEVKLELRLVARRAK
jgi:polyisoprenoid-binding protein YceI